MRRSAKRNGQRHVQMKLDFGQRRFGSVQCPTCGMLYLPSVEEDVRQHDRYHKSVSVSTIKVSRWKNDKVVEEFFDGSRILSVPYQDWRLHPRFGELRQAMDAELGCDDSLCGPASSRAGRAVFMQVSARGELAGCCIAEQVDAGYRVLRPPGGKENRVPADLCTMEVGERPEVARCGVHRIWTAPRHRGEGIATALLDSARRHLIYGLAVPRDQVAFVDPTPSGRRLAEKYSGRPDFLVYRSLSGGVDLGDPKATE